MPDNEFRLITLGRLALRVSAGSGLSEEELGPHRQKLALLAVLALSPRPLSRDQLIGLFWGDQPQERARHSLSNALSFLRRILGREAIRPHRDEVALSPGIPLRVDARDFERAVTTGRFPDALASYQGPFLDGVYLAGAGEFERWVEGERGRLETLFLRACAGSVEGQASAGEWDQAELSARRWLDTAPLSAEAAVALIDAITARGTREADQRALAEYDRLVTLLGEEYHRRPDRGVMDRAREIVERLRAGDATGEFRVPAWALEPAEPAAPEPAKPVSDSTESKPLSTTPGRRTRIRWWQPVAAVAVLAMAWLWWSGRGSAPATPPGPPVVAIGPVRAPADSAGAWLGEGMIQMLAARLARSTMVEVVSPERMRELLPASAGLSQVLDAARRAGAQWVVSGGITRAEQGYVMDVNIHAVADGRLAALNTVTGNDPIALADRVAVLAMVAAGTSPVGPSLAEVETANPLAYEAYVRYLRAAHEERTLAAVTALDEAIALDSGFVTALRERASLAFPTGDARLLGTLLDAFRRHESRATEFDRTYLAAQTAFYAGEHERARALTRHLVERYPRDPRSYELAYEILNAHGRWQEAEDLVLQLLALDPTATRAAAGPCVPCASYGRLSYLRMARGHLEGAEEATRRYTRFAPDVAQSWDHLSIVLAARGRFAEALDATWRMETIGEDGLRRARQQQIRLFLMMREWERADSAVRAFRREASPGELPSALDLSAIVHRERGRHRAAVAALDSMAWAGTPGTLQIVAGNSLGRIGQYDAARRRFPAPPPPAAQVAGPNIRRVELRGDLARAFAWHRALEADAIAESGDTLRMRAIADSLERLAGWSYYGRDWRLHHHVRGLLLARAGRHEEAIAEFRTSHWGLMGWNRTLAEQAKSELALGRPEEALATLRRAYIVPLDAMGRYQPRTELDWLMAQALRAAGQADSAAIYDRWVMEAWADADPEIRAKLERP